LVWLSAGAVALGLRALSAAVRRPWHDEYFTVWAAGLSWKDLAAALRLDSGPPLLYALVKAVAGTGVDPLVAARAVAVLAGTAAVLVAARATRHLAGERGALLAAALLATHPLAVAWSSEGRAYPLLLLAATLVWERLESLRAGTGGAAGLGGAVALGCWSHGLGLVLALAAVAGSLTLNGATRRRALTATAAGLATFLPWIPIAAVQPAASVAWMSGAWAAVGLPDKLASPLRLVAPLAPFGEHLDLPSAPLTAWAIAVAALLVLLVGAPLRGPGWPLFLLPALALPAAASFGVPVYFPGRGEALWLAPALGLAAAGALGPLWRRSLVASLVAASLGATALTIRAWATTPPRPEERLARRIAQALPAGGTVVATGYWWLDLWATLPPPATRWTLEAFPPDGAHHPGWVASQAPPPAEEDVTRLASLFADTRRIAVVVTPGQVSAPQLTRLAARAGLRPALEVPGGVLHLRPEVRP